MTALTDRQREAGEMLLAGLDRTEIARRMGITRDAVGGYVYDMRRRLGVQDEAELVERLREMNKSALEKLRGQPRRWCDV